MVSNKWKLPIVIVGLLTIASLFLAGCGNKETTTLSAVENVSEDGVAHNLENAGDVSDVDGVEAMCEAEEEAAEEAVCYAQDSNAGSEFEVTSIVIAEEWARVDIQEIGVPIEEAVAFEVFLVAENDGEWLVKKTGTSITVDDLPDAPPQIFK